MARGVSKAIQRGAFDNSTIESMMISGFWDREHAKIHDKICPNDDFSVEEIDAEAQLKIRVAHDLIGERAKELPEQEIKSAKYKIILVYIISRYEELDLHLTNQLNGHHQLRFASQPCQYFYLMFYRLIQLLYLLQSHEE